MGRVDLTVGPLGGPIHLEGNKVKRIDVKPLSVNEAWQGRRYKTRNYKIYEQEMLLRLPPLEIPDGELIVRYVFGVSALYDWDNAVKPFQDILQKRYSFDDRRIVRAIVDKVKVKKGDEYVAFSIEAAH